MTDRDRDIFILAVTADCEAANQGDDGIAGCLWSIVNRTAAKKWFSGKTLAATCVMPSAYSSWNTKDPNRVRVLSAGVADPTFYKCLTMAAAVIDGTIPDPTDGATHYYAVSIPEPGWVTGHNAAGEKVEPDAIFTKQIKDHRFYRGVA